MTDVGDTGFRAIDPATGSPVANNQGGQQDGNNDQQNADGTDGNDGQNNNKDKVDFDPDFWQNKTENKTDENNQQTIVVESKPQEPTADEAFQEHIKSLDLTGDIDFAKVQADMSNGETQSFQQALEDVAAKSYRSSLVNLNKVINEKVDAAVQTATTQAIASTRTEGLINQMEAAMSFTADANIQPVARAVLKQAINKGQEPAKAIESVEKFFSALNKKTATKPQNKPGFQGSMNDGEMNFEDDGEEPDFLALLSGKE